MNDVFPAPEPKSRPAWLPPTIALAMTLIGGLFAIASVAALVTHRPGQDQPTVPSPAGTRAVISQPANCTRSRRRPHGRAASPDG